LVIKAWFIFVGGVAVTIAVDYFLRMQDGNIRTGGIPHEVMASIHIVLAAISLWMLIRATKALSKSWKRVFLLCLQVAIGFALYAFSLLFYVIESGIDSV